jgi:hypothetical protein
MAPPTHTNGNATAAEEQLAVHPSQIPTHPDEIAKLPAPNFAPDGVSPPIKHPLDPLNAGKNSENELNGNRSLSEQVTRISRHFI